MKNDYGFRVTKKHFTLPAVSLNAMHYHIYDGCYEVQKGRLAIDSSFYQLNRRKWYGDTSYLTDIEFIKALFAFGVRKGLIPAIPDQVTHFVNNAPDYIEV